ncbi:arginase family protein [Candidatus Pacearchaeota archaeon]|nr:arginase family protein [Candidatus Pacearchaeota archaeon]
MIIKVPGINGLGKTKGCEDSGNVVLDSLKEIFSNEQGKVIDVQSLDLEEIHLDNGNVEKANDLIYRNAFEFFGEKVIFLGGDHSISYSTTRAFFDHCQNSGKEPCLIVFDAHPDLMTPVDRKIPTHEEWLRALIEDGFPKQNILLVGIRNSDSQEMNFIQNNKIKFLGMNNFLGDISDVCDSIMEFASGKELYVSLDIDVVDPAFAPATGYPESGGLTSRQIIYLMQRISKMKNLRAVDIVEINSEKDENNLTVKLGAKILSELI